MIHEPITDTDVDHPGLLAEIVKKSRETIRLAALFINTLFVRP